MRNITTSGLRDTLSHSVLSFFCFDIIERKLCLCFPSLHRNIENRRVRAKSQVLSGEHPCRRKWDHPVIVVMETRTTMWDLDQERTAEVMTCKESDVKNGL